MNKGTKRRILKEIPHLLIEVVSAVVFAVISGISYSLITLIWQSFMAERAVL